jgi:PEP-CTERM motif-containing protein
MAIGLKSATGSGAMTALALAAGLALGTAAHAGVTMNLFPLLSTGGSSGDLVIEATVTNDTAATFFLNGDAFSTGSLSPYVTSVDDSDFFADSPLSLGAGGSATFDFFDVKYAGAPTGTYTVFADARLLGGPTASSIDFVTGNTISVMVQGSSISPTPEPATWGLMLLGFGGMGALLRRARRHGEVGFARA